MKKEIAVGDYVHIATWKPGDKLYSEWIEQYPEEYNGVIAGLNPKEEILPAGKYVLKVDYPLSVPFEEELEFGNPITREQLVKWIVDSYHCIYEIEDQTSDIAPGFIPEMLNRNTTSGQFGIWGHDIDDLDLHTVEIDENNVITVFGVDS